MTNIIPFNPPKPEPEPEPAPFLPYTSAFLAEYDYQSAWAYAPDSLKERSQDILDLATGALIACRLKHDLESAALLANLFARKVRQERSSFLLKELPEFARGYVWSYKGSLLVQSRVEVQFGPAPEH